MRMAPSSRTPSTSSSVGKTHTAAVWARSRLIALPIKKQLLGASCAIPNATTSVIMPDLATTAINAAARAGMTMVFFVTEVTTVVVLVSSSVAGITGHHHHPPLANIRPTVDAFWGTQRQDLYAAESSVAVEDKTVLDFVIILALAVIRTGLAATCAAFLEPAMGTHMELRRVARKRYTAHTAWKQPRVLLVGITTLVCVTRNVAVVSLASVQFAGAMLQQ